MAGASLPAGRLVIRRASAAASGSATRRNNLRTQRLVALFIAAGLVFNFPLMVVWGRDATVFGLPLLPVALFGLWALLIVLLALVVERGER